jgi:hypothetical protein
LASWKHRDDGQLWSRENEVERTLMYRVLPDAYVIYSVDRNRVDDNGVINMFGSGREGLALRPGDRAGRDLGIRIPLAPKS